MFIRRKKSLEKSKSRRDEWPVNGSLQVSSPTETDRQTDFVWKEQVLKRIKRKMPHHPHSFFYSYIAWCHQSHERQEAKCPYIQSLKDYSGNGKMMTMENLLFLSDPFISHVMFSFSFYSWCFIKILLKVTMTWPDKGSHVVHEKELMISIWDTSSQFFILFITIVYLIRFLVNDSTYVGVSFFIPCQGWWDCSVCLCCVSWLLDLIFTGFSTKNEETKCSNHVLTTSYYLWIIIALLSFNLLSISRKNEITMIKIQWLSVFVKNFPIYLVFNESLFICSLPSNI